MTKDEVLLALENVKKSYENNINSVFELVKFDEFILDICRVPQPLQIGGNEQWKIKE